MPCGTWSLDCLHPSLLSRQEVGIASLKLYILILRLSSRTLVLTESPLSYHLSPGWPSRLISKTTFITAHSGSEMRLSDIRQQLWFVGASLVIQQGKNLPARQETLVRFLGREDPRGEGVGYPFQYSWASLVAQTVKNLPAMKDPWVGKTPWRGAWQPTPVFSPGESPWIEKPGGLQSMGSQRVEHHWVTKHSTWFVEKRKNLGLETDLGVLKWELVARVQFQGPMADSA